MWDEGNGDVDLLALKIDGFVAGDDPDVDAWMQPIEAREPRRKPEGGERGRGCDRKNSLRIDELSRRVVDPREYLLSRLKKLLARRGELERAVYPMKKRLSELLFERLDPPTDRRLRERQLLRGAGKAQVASGGIKATQKVE